MATMLHIVDAFTATPFAGNPAAVCVLDAPREEAWMKHVAREMNLSETAFLHRREDGWALRWFTPVSEVRLCGHATLASAFTLWETGALQAAEEGRFYTLSGLLVCRRESGGWIAMDFPAANPELCEPPKGLSDALGCTILAAASSDTDYLVEIAEETKLRAMRPNISALAKLPMRGVIVTCRSARPEFDFVSRFFAPAVGVNEDPVTGSAHCVLGPYWQSKLGKAEFTACQASARGGLVKVSVHGDRVTLRGQAVMMSRVELLH
jgi:PhzF family phenazine biosynthesis protein